MKLTVELVPATAWGHNLRQLLPQKEWDRLRRHCYKKAQYRCEICAGKGPKHPVECHERWTYDDETNIQKLEGVIALCPSCHEVKHIGRAHIVGRGQQARKHLQKINDWSSGETSRYLDHAFQLWEQRSQQEWDLDISWLTTYNSSHSEGNAEKTEE